MDHHHQIDRHETVCLCLCLLACQVMFPHHIMRFGFSIRERIRWRAVENCPIVPTDLTFHRYWTILFDLILHLPPNSF